jgi:hypothetical protein
MVIDYFNGFVRARSLDTTTQIKIMGEPLLVFTGLWFDFLRLKYTRLCHGRRKNMMTSKVCLFFRGYFVIMKTVYVSLPCTICFNEYIDCKKISKKIQST